MPDFSGVRPWMRGLTSKIAASVATLGAGELLVDEQGGVYGGNGGVISTLKRLVRIDEVTTAVQQYVTSLVVNSTTLQGLAASTGYVYAIVDQNGRLALGIKLDGTVDAKVSVTDGQITLPKLSASVQSQLMPTGYGQYYGPLPASTGYLYGILDANGRILFGIKADATLVGKIVTPDASITLPKLDPSVSQLLASSVAAAQSVQSLPTNTGYLWAMTDVTGRKLLAIKADATVEGKFASTAAVTALTDSNGLTVPAVSTWPPSAWGDSTTQGNDLTLAQAWPGQLGTLLGVTVENNGSNGAESNEIAFRQGGYAWPCTVTGGSIPTSGPVTVVPLGLTVNGGPHSGPLAGGAGSSIAVAILGITGMLTRSGSTYTFTRDTPGSAVSAPNTVDIYSTYGSARAGRLAIINAGVNDEPLWDASTYTVDQTIANIVSMVSSLTAGCPRFLVWSMLDRGVSEGAATTRGGYIRQVNTFLAKQYGANYVDVREYLVQRGLADAGISPTSGDNTDIAADAVPTSLREGSGSVHLNATGHAVQAALFARILRAKGWATT